MLKNETKHQQFVWPFWKVLMFCLQFKRRMTLLSYIGFGALVIFFVGQPWGLLLVVVRQQFVIRPCLLLNQKLKYLPGGTITFTVNCVSFFHPYLNFHPTLLAENEFDCATRRIYYIQVFSNENWQLLQHSIYGYKMWNQKMINSLLLHSHTDIKYQATEAVSVWLLDLTLNTNHSIGPYCFLIKAVWMCTRPLPEMNLDACVVYFLLLSIVAEWFSNALICSLAAFPHILLPISRRP